MIDRPLYVQGVGGDNTGLTAESRTLRRHGADGDSDGRPAICHPNGAVPSDVHASSDDRGRDRANRPCRHRSDIGAFRAPAPG